jgi:hypothetical protein
MASYTTDGVYVIEPDKHVPFHCRGFSNVVLETIHHVKPDGYINLGDALDFFQLSDFDKDPRRINFVDEDMADYVQYLDDIERTMPKGGVVHQLEGNHEDRLRRYVWRRAPAITGLVGTVATSIQLPERNRRGRLRWVWHPIDNWCALRIGNTVIHHGHYFNKHTAVNNLDRYRGCNIVHGHTHRLQYAHNGDYWSATVGHGSDPKLTMHTPTPSDWQQALGLLTVYKGKGSIELFEVNKGVAHIRGKLIKG